MKKLILLIIIGGLVWLLWGAVKVDRQGGNSSISIDETKPKEKLQMLEQKGESLLNKGEGDSSTKK
ncbi:MAG TPA: hypothetical protein QF761_09510 [Pirellulales bacterium]|jgi:hypothetical protein|nr:hypothetical protein [Pirellulales bacterium]|tara:strand:+ start:868 stop:1065 length:198 start_codon:yes stop_codon:yes gene_type:complete